MPSGVEHQMPTAEYPAMSPDGTRVVFVSNTAGSRDLWIAHADGSNMTRLTPWPESDERSPTWTSDGAGILFSSTRNASTHNIWRIDPDGSNATQLTVDIAEHDHPRVSPSGLEVVYISNATGKNELWRMMIDGAGQQSIALISLLVSDPAWSPAGDRVVYVGCRRGGACNLFVLGLDGSGATQVTDGEFQDWAPDWGPRGIVFASNRAGMQGLWVVQPDGTGLQQLTDPDRSGDLDPRWVGTTGAVVFSRSGVAEHDAAADIWILHPDASEARLTALQSEPPDEDADGVADVGEHGPQGDDPDFDGNADGTPDWEQAHVASLHSSDGMHYLTLEIPVGAAFMMVRAVPNPSPGDAPRDQTFPYGFYEFVIKGIAAGGPVSLTMHLPGPVEGFYKWGPRPDQVVSAWYPFMYDGATGARFAGSRVTLHFVDGSRGDDDLNSMNGQITDQGGPTVPANGAPVPAAAPVLSPLGAMLLILALVGVASRAGLRRAE